MTPMNLEKIAMGLLLEFMLQEKIMPLESSVVISDYGPHRVYSLAGRWNNAVNTDGLLLKLISFVNRRNAISVVKFLAYRVEHYGGRAIYISLSH